MNENEMCIPPKVQVARDIIFHLSNVPPGRFRGDDKVSLSCLNEKEKATYDAALDVVTSYIASDS